MATLSMPLGVTTLVSPRDGVLFARLIVSHGVLRLSASYGAPLDDITLAFAGRGQSELVRLDHDRAYVLEAVADSELELEYHGSSTCAPELITTWLLSFNLIRHHLSAEQRISKLLYLLAKQFGSPSQRGISIPFTLPHTRLAELIGCTRPTVTRQLISLRERGELHISETDNSMLLIPSDD